jgi:hypothetical protein
VLFGVELPGESGADGPGGNADAGAGTDSDTTAGKGGAAGGNATAGTGAIDGGGDAMALLEARSGTRLKAVRYKGADGSEYPTSTWFDASLNEDCTFKAAADGKLRCLPDGHSVTSSTYLYFADAGCTAPIVFNEASSCGSLPHYGTRSDDTCPFGTHVFDRGQSVALYYRFFDTCEGPLPVGPGQTAYVPVEVHPSEFVEANRFVAP